MDVELHDHVLASSSHLPIYLLITLVDALAKVSVVRMYLNCAAGGFRDFTRIASSDPLGRDVLWLFNKDATFGLRWIHFTIASLIWRTAISAR